jgi:hypothetical protein
LQAQRCAAQAQQQLQRQRQPRCGDAVDAA